MTEYNPGQRLTLAHDDGSMIVGTYGRDVVREEKWLIWAGGVDPFGALVERGFRVTHLDGEPLPEAPALPSQDGAYGPFDLDGDVWYYATYEEVPRGFVEANWEPEYWHPVGTLDEHRPIIAAEVFHWFEQAYRDLANPTRALPDARDHFGVSE